MTNKKALSDVVTTVLIILFAIIAVTIIGGIVLSQVNKAGTKVNDAALCTDFQFTPVKCVSDGTNSATLIIRRDSSSTGNGATVSSVKAVFEDSAGAIVSSADVVSELGSDVKSSIATAPNTDTGLKTKAGIAVTLKDSAGRAVACDYYITTKVGCVAA